MTKLLSHSVKTDKGLKTHNVGTAVMYLAPASLSGHNVCPMSSAGCRAVCLHDTGMLAFKNAQRAQLTRTELFWNDRAEFIAQLAREISLHDRACTRIGARPAVRLNGTSDIRWEVIAPDLFAAFPHVKFYDYTKLANRRQLPRNYSLTFSLSETSRSIDHAAIALETMNVAVVLSGCGSSRHPKPFPRNWNGRKVIDGDRSDVRFMDRPRRGAYVALRAKGKATRDDSGFVRDAWTTVAA